LQRSVYIAPTTGSSKPDKSAKRLLAERHENEEKQGELKINPEKIDLGELAKHA
jgi:hypothetical protein